MLHKFLSSCITKKTRYTNDVHRLMTFRHLNVQPDTVSSEEVGGNWLQNELVRVSRNISDLTEKCILNNFCHSGDSCANFHKFSQNSFRVHFKMAESMWFILWPHSHLTRKMAENQQKGIQATFKWNNVWSSIEKRSRVRTTTFKAN